MLTVNTVSIGDCKIRTNLKIKQNILTHVIIRINLQCVQYRPIGWQQLPCVCVFAPVSIFVQISTPSSLLQCDGGHLRLVPEITDYFWMLGQRGGLKMPNPFAACFCDQTVSLVVTVSKSNVLFNPLWNILYPWFFFVIIIIIMFIYIASLRKLTFWLP